MSKPKIGRIDTDTRMNAFTNVGKFLNSTCLGTNFEDCGESCVIKKEHSELTFTDEDGIFGVKGLVYESKKEISYTDNTKEKVELVNKQLPMMIQVLKDTIEEYDIDVLITHNEGGEYLSHLHHRVVHLQMI